MLSNDRTPKGDGMLLELAMRDVAALTHMDAKALSDRSRDGDHGAAVRLATTYARIEILDRIGVNKRWMDVNARLHLESGDGDTRAAVLAAADHAWASQVGYWLELNGALASEKATTNEPVRK
jgi:hypothetical protein